MSLTARRRKTAGGCFHPFIHLGQSASSSPLRPTPSSTSTSVQGYSDEQGRHRPWLPDLLCYIPHSRCTTAVSLAHVHVVPFSRFAPLEMYDRCIFLVICLCCMAVAAYGQTGPRLMCVLICKFCMALVHLFCDMQSYIHFR